jgi:hypothetical protein
VISGPTKWFTVAKLLEAAVYGELTTKPDRHSVVPGAIAWDACDCGMLAVSVGQVYLTDTFPEPMTTVISPACTAAFEAAEIVIQLIRCAPSATGKALWPPTAELEAAAQIMDEDAADVMRAAARALCEAQRDDDIIEHLIGVVDPQGPEGGCVGVQLGLIVALERS